MPRKGARLQGFARALGAGPELFPPSLGKFDRATFVKQHVAPFKPLIDADLPTIMAAFAAYPSFGSDDLLATTDGYYWHSANALLINID